MHRYLWLGLGLLVGGCVRAKAPVVEAPTAPVATACGKDDAATPIFLVDGKPVMCAAAMSIPTSRIESVEVLKGAAAVSSYGPWAATGVVVIRTKQER
jgi:TonB-dependent SusC/RagA subfamily outer membrane receptor